MRNRYFTNDAFKLVLAVYAGIGLLAFLIVWSI